MLTRDLFAWEGRKGREGERGGERRGGEGKGKDRSSMASQSPDKTSKFDLLTYLNLIFSISD